MPASPATPAPEFDLGTFAGDLVHQVIETWASSPPFIVLTVLAVTVTLGAVRSARSVIHGRHAKDPVRKFSGVDRRIIFERAGMRCEFFFLGMRCQSRSDLQADHVHPHSRGGWTSIANGQALCKDHNRRKSARVPWDWQLARLEKRRVRYFADGHVRAVTRHGPRSR